MSPNRPFPVNGANVVDVVDSHSNAEALKQEEGKDYGSSNNVAAMRRRNARGYWFSHTAPARDENNDLRALSLESFSAMNHAPEEWLQALDDQEKKDARPDDDVWLNFACPVRISNPKVGVCVSPILVLLSWVETCRG